MPNNDALNILSMLSKGLSKGANVGTGIWNQAQKEWQNVIDNPIEGGGGMTAAGPVIGQLLQLIAQSGKGANAVSGGGIAADAGQYANELVMKEREKVIKQTAKAQAQEAIAAGATPDQVIMGQAPREVTATKATPTFNAIMTSAGPGVKGAPIQPAQAPVAPQEEVLQQDNSKMKNVLNFLQRFASAYKDGSAGIVNYETAKTLRQQREVGMTAAESQKAGIDLYEAAVKESRKGLLTPDSLFTKYESASKDFSAVLDGYARIKEAMTVDGQLDFSGKTLSDLDLLFGTAKTLDGGRVTDSDIAIQTLATGKFGDKVKKAARNFVARKGILLPEERKLLYNAATKRFDAAQREQANRSTQFKKLAEKNGIDPTNIIRDMGMASDSSTQIDNDVFTASDGSKVRRIS